MSVIYINGISEVRPLIPLLFIRNVLRPLWSTHKPKINYIPDESKKEIMGKILENPLGFSINFLVPQKQIIHLLFYHFVFA